MKKLILLSLLVTACGPSPATKQFFDNACKDYKTDSKPQVEREKEQPADEDDNKADSTPEPSPTPPDYDNRCSEADKQQIIADHEAKNIRRFADLVQEMGRDPTPAEIQVSFEEATKRCDKLRACSGLALEVTMPPGSKTYSCGMKNGQNWVEIGCEAPESTNQ